jgi:hypothetical protein
MISKTPTTTPYIKKHQVKRTATNSIDLKSKKHEDKNMKDSEKRRAIKKHTELKKINQVRNAIEEEKIIE